MSTLIHTRYDGNMRQFDRNRACEAMSSLQLHFAPQSCFLCRLLCPCVVAHFSAGSYGLARLAVQQRASQASHVSS